MTKSQINLLLKNKNIVSVYVTLMNNNNFSLVSKLTLELENYQAFNIAYSIYKG